MSPQKLPAALMSQLAGHASARRFASGDVLVREGSYTSGIYILVSGRLNVFTANTEGRELIYNTLVPGELFGEMFLDGGARSASVRAVVESVCIPIRAQELVSFIAAHPEFAHFLLMTLSHRLRHATEQVRQLGLNDVSERVIGVLKSETVVVDGRHVIPRNLTQQEISQRVGATREMVNHVIQRLVRQGYLHKTGRRDITVVRVLPTSIRTLSG